MEPQHPLLQTSRSEIRTVLAGVDPTDPGTPAEDPLDFTGGSDPRPDLVPLIDSASEDDLAYIARKAGDLLMEGGDYWEALFSTAESWAESRRQAAKSSASGTGPV